MHITLLLLQQLELYTMYLNWFVFNLKKSPGVLFVTLLNFTPDHTAYIKQIRNYF